MSIESRRELYTLLRERQMSRLYSRVNELASKIGSEEGVELTIHFPAGARVREEDLGSRDISIVWEKGRKRLRSLSLKELEQRLLQTLPEARLQAVEFGYEGFNVIVPDGRVTILPGAVHVWATVTSQISSLLDWFMEKECFLRQ